MKSSAELKGAYRRQPLRDNAASTGVLRKKKQPLQSNEAGTSIPKKTGGINDDFGEETVEEENGGGSTKNTVTRYR